MDNDMIEMNRSMLERLIRRAYRAGRRAKEPNGTQYAIGVVEAEFPMPLRFCDLKPGDKFKRKGGHYTFLVFNDGRGNELRALNLGTYQTYCFSDDFNVMKVV